MKKEELISIIRERNPLLADAVSHMVDYVTDKYRLHIRTRNRQRL